MGNKKIDDALNIDLDKELADIDAEVDSEDKELLKKHEERRNMIDEVKQNLKDARSMSNKEWAQALLKRSAETILTTQEIFAKEVEDNPVSKNVTALGELSNSLVNTVDEVNKLDHEEEKLQISKDKNRLRQAELQGDRGPLLDMPGDEENKVVAIGKGTDILKLLGNGIDPTEVTANDEEEK